MACSALRHPSAGLVSVHTVKKEMSNFDASIFAYLVQRATPRVNGVVTKQAHCVIVTARNLGDAVRDKEWDKRELGHSFDAQILKAELAMQIRPTDVEGTVLSN